ncbi:MAG: PspC domain-containing protein [Lachnospiraceae bacterium]|nr:PspC domain-containing protein [Lachnospiraceae bacterium]
MEKKRLYKSSTNKVLCGVCGGIGEYFDVDPTIVRLICIALIFGWGSGLLAYIVAAVIMPERPSGL